ncbi:MAG: hypothetical protein QF616_09410, partial [Candidatus Marinimicrobia bacterium]|nr:hypothetical protein [Candidatus Neomarinimicrobiota bacterium]
MPKIVRITTLFIPFFLFAQNVDMYLSLLHEGQTDGVKEYLPELISKYPNDPGVRYLQALMTSDGMKSLEMYSSLLEKYPKSKYAPEAAVKIG